MSEGFVVSDKVRTVLFSAIAKGEQDLGSIVKRHRLIPQAAERAVKELATEGLIAQKGRAWGLTEKGQDVARGLAKRDTSSYPT